MSALVFFLAVCVGVIDLHEVPKNERVPALQSASWADTMQRLAATFNHLLPYLTSGPRFSSDLHQDAIEGDIRELVTISESMRHGGAVGEPEFPDQDPTLPIVSRLLVSNVENAYLLFRLGQKEPARHLLRGTVSQCATCHLRGPDETAAGANIGTENTAGLGARERITIDLALRRFKDAKRTINGVLSDPNAFLSQPDLWLGAAQAGLILSIQIDENPARSQQIAQIVMSSSLPQPRKDQARGWMKSIQAWQEEPAPSSTVNRLTLARALVTKPDCLAGDSVCSGEADVCNLRATSLLHAYLRGSAGEKQVGEALLLLGRAYQDLVSFEMWHLPSLYYEACILSSPHTPVARECFERYRRGLSADSGDWLASTLPSPVAEDVLLLEELSSPQPLQY